MNKSLQGECNCGAVKFELLTSVRSMYKCYCTMCQKQSGTASNASTIVMQSDFRWLHGVEEIKVWKKDSGFNSHFCMTCGSPVPNPIADKYMWIPVGLIGSIDAKVVVNLFEDTKPQWEEDCVHQTDVAHGVKDADDLFSRLNTDAQL